MRRVFSLVFLFSALACTQEINIPLPDSKDQVVIESWIENGSPAKVIVTRSAGFFEPIYADSIQNYVVLNAQVTLSDGVNSELLSLQIDESVFPPFLYVSSTMLGEVGKTYELEVVADEDTLRATTQILDPIRPDSLWFELEEGEDSLGYLKALVTDPDTPGNRYRFFSKRLGRDLIYYPIIGDLREDVLVNGLSFETFFYRGNAPSDSTGEESAYFRLGDTIVLKTTHIDFDHYKFWESIDNNSGGNPFSSPGNVRSNVSGGFGIWGGYAAEYDTVIAIP